MSSSQTAKIKTGRIHKAKDNCDRFKYRSVVRMMGVMQEKEGTLPAEFLVSGRTGRRNAVPDILAPGSQADSSLAQLPEKLQQLATSDPDEMQPCSSGASQQQPSTSSSDQSQQQHNEASKS